MFATYASPGVPLLRVPMVVTTTRGPAARVAEDVELLTAAAAASRRTFEEAEAEAVARARVSGGGRAIVLRRPRQPQRWENIEPGAALGSQIEHTEVGDCDDYELVEVIAAVERQKAHLAAFQARAMAELADREIYTACTCEHEGACSPHDCVKAAAQEVSAAVRWTPGHATQRVHQSVTMAESCPATLAALSRGEIDEYRARIIVDETASLAFDPQVRARAEAEVLAGAGHKTGPQVRALAKRRVLAAAPEVAQRRGEQARQGRHVTKPSAEPDGMARLSMVGPAEDVTAFYTALDAAARARKAEPNQRRNLEQLRFDVLADLGWSGLEVGHLGCCHANCATGQRLGGRHGQAATVNLTMPLSMLAASTAVEHEPPAELDGYGPVTAQVALAIAAGGTLRRLITDPVTGRLLEYEQTRYEPPEHLAAHVIARDRTCRFPTCNWQARACDIDHTIAYREGGPTNATNLGPLHRAHHNGKTHHGWRLAQLQAGRFVWISPAGHLYHINPEAVGPTQAKDPHPRGDPDPPSHPDQPPL